MKKNLIYICSVFLIIIGLTSCGGGTSSNDTINNSGSSFNSTLSQTQQRLFSQFGIGAAIGPHMDNQTNYNSNTLNAVYYSFVNLDIAQLNSYGFKLVRLYNDSTNTYVSAINSLPAGMKLVYQYTLCQSDPQTGACYDVPGTNISQIEAAQTAQLQAVVQAVGASTFASKVALIIVGNEDFVASQSNPNSFNQAAIINAMNSVTSQAATLGISSIPLSSSFVVFNPAYVTSAQMDALTAIWSNANYTGPLIFDLYPYQFGVGGENAVGAVNSNNVNSLSGMINGITSLSNCLTNSNLDTSTCVNYINNIVDIKGIMIGETGWPNAGTPKAGEYDQPTTISGSIAGATQYTNDALTYVSNKNIPTLMFEAYDQMNKDESVPTDPENSYGIMSWNSIPWYSVNAGGITITASSTTYQFNAQNVLIINPNQVVGWYTLNGVQQNFIPTSTTAIGLMLNTGINTFNFSRQCNGLTTSQLCSLTVNTTPTPFSFLNQSPLPAGSYIGCGQGASFDAYNGISYGTALGPQTATISSVLLGAAGGSDCN